MIPERERPADSLREVTFERNYTRYAEGSVLVCFGETRVLCTATVEENVPPWLRGAGRGWVTAEYAMLPRSTHSRVSRDKSTKGRAKEISRLIGRSLRSVVDLEKLGERQVVIDCDVLQADGGTRTASITGAFVALSDALNGLVESGSLADSPCIGQCAAVSVGILGGEARLDLCYEEDSAADVDLNLVMRENGDFVEVQGTAEGKPFSRAEMDAMLDLGTEGISALLALQRKALSID